MSSNSTWIEEQKANRLFRGGGQNSDALKMLEHGPTNRYLSTVQGRKITSARIIGEIMGITCIGHLCDMIEKAQMCVDGRSRADFMKVAIEQWQGKIASKQHKFSVSDMV